MKFFKDYEVDGQRNVDDVVQKIDYSKIGDEGVMNCLKNFVVEK